MQYEIKHRWTGAVLFTAELGAEYEAKSGGIKLGAAIRLAFRARANLADANLAGANLAGADLADADLAGANLAGADLIDGGQDSRGFRFWAWHKDGVITYRAGCHTWTDVVAALVYYGDGYPSDGDRFDCAARLHFMHQIAQKRWSV